MISEKTQSQKNHLVEQNQRILHSAIAKGLTIDKQLQDIKSGMNHDRAGFQELLIDICSGRVELLIIENKDRLVRFGFETLESIFKIPNEPSEAKKIEKYLIFEKIKFY